MLLKVKTWKVFHGSNCDNGFIQPPPAVGVAHDKIFRPGIVNNVLCPNAIQDRIAPDFHLKPMNALFPPRTNIVGPFFGRSEEHTSELQSLMRISYAVFCLTNK